MHFLCYGTCSSGTKTAPFFSVLLVFGILLEFFAVGPHMPSVFSALHAGNSPLQKFAINLVAPGLEAEFVLDFVIGLKKDALIIS